MSWSNIKKWLTRESMESDLSLGLIEKSKTITQSSTKVPVAEEIKVSVDRDVSVDPLNELLDRIEKARLNYELKLDLSSLNLTSVPESISQLTSLRFLNLADNQLTELPELIGQLKQLTALYVSNNRLIQLPESIGQLHQLQHLDLMGNQLTELPESIGQLTKLETLYLCENRLIELPPSLNNLKSLRALFLHGNEPLRLPAEVLGPTRKDALLQQPASPNEILDYYFRLSRGKRPLNEAKLILIGRGKVGKTSLVNRLVHNLHNTDEKKTEGINITQWPIRLPNNENVNLHIWDFGGQEIMHATHQFFLTQRSLYLLVLNGREGGEDADAEYWLKLIKSFGGESPVIIVLNKIKEHSFDINRRALQQKYGIRDFVLTDCEDGTGIHELRRSIERETDHLEGLHDAFPSIWFAIKDRLAGMKKNYLDFDEYRDFCNQRGEPDPKAQEALAGYLHNLGVVLNYREDPRLQDTHILNPHWVTNGIYKILNSDNLQRQKGVIRLADLTEVLDATEYPASMRRFILDLMKKFDLCFSFPDEETYLIPELLDKQEPIEAGGFKPEECLNFQYHYSVLPEGLLPRFIVRTHLLSEGLKRWRTGAFLRFEGNWALVKADVQDKKVFIYVSGADIRGRRRLLAVIRSEFERIHHDIRNLEPREMVPLPQYPGVAVPYQKLILMEQRGIERFPEVAGHDVIELDVDELLNGVDMEGTRKPPNYNSGGGRSVRLFYSYSHKDESLRQEMETHLKLLRRQGLIEPWNDREITAGDEWKQQIDENLERADVILLLVSADFMASDYCYDLEVTRALERHKNGEAKVIPVIIRDVNWKAAPWANLQALPKDGIAVTTWQSRDTAWRNVSEGIEKVVKTLTGN